MEKKRCEGELKEKLAEVEGRDKAREAMPTQVEKTVSDGSDTVEKGNRKGKDTSVRAKQRAISTGWEFRRKKGENKTPLSAGYSRKVLPAGSFFLALYSIACLAGSLGNPSDPSSIEIHYPLLPIRS